MFCKPSRDALRSPSSSLKKEEGGPTRLFSTRGVVATVVGYPQQRVEV